MKREFFRISTSFIFLAMFIAMSFSAIAQNKVTGTIIDDATGKGVPFVNVGLFRQADSVFVSGAASDDKGVFELLAIPDGAYRLQVSAIGYQSFEQMLEVNGNHDMGRLRLQAGSTTLSEVTISEKRPLFAVEGEKTMYNVAEDPSIQTGTASDALQNAPGVQVDVEGNITLRGTSSVEVWINDKPSHLSGENLKTYIQQMPANSIDRVEVITNPSARYGSKADGIINIVTNAKIQKNQFFSFGVNAYTSPAVFPWMSYVWSNEKLTVNAYLHAGTHAFHGNTYSNDSLFVGDHVLARRQIDSAAYSQSEWRGGAFLSVDYEMDTANSLNFWGNFVPMWIKADSKSSVFREDYMSLDGNPFASPLLTNYSILSDTKFTGFFGMAGVYYQHKFDNEGHMLMVSANGMGFGYGGDSPYERHYVSPVLYDKISNKNSLEKQSSGEVEIVYTRPYSQNGEISVGLNSSIASEESQNRLDTLVDGAWVNDMMRSYKANFNTFDNEAFITLQHKFGGFTVKPGVRFCSELVKGMYPDSAQYNFNKHFFSVRPSLHLSYMSPSMHTFRASYTRRIACPNASDLGSFPMYDEESYRIGNPELERIYTNSFEAGWTKYWMSFGSIGLTAYYRGKSNEVNSIQLSTFHPLYGRVVPFNYPVNVGRSYNAGGEFNMMYRPNGFFNLRFYANLYDSYLETKFQDETFKNNMWSYSFSMNLWTKLWNKLELTASGYYTSPTQTLFIENHARYGINLGLRADFFNRKMSVFVNAEDIFHWESWGESQNNPYVSSTSTSKYNSREIAVGILFRFGKMELEQVARQGDTEGGGSGPSGMGM